MSDMNKSGSSGWDLARDIFDKHGLLVIIALPISFIVLVWLVSHIQTHNGKKVTLFTIPLYTKGGEPMSTPSLPLNPSTVPNSTVHLGTNDIKSSQVWKGNAQEKSSQGYSMNLYIEEMSGKVFLGSVHWPDINDSTTKIDGEIVSSFGDDREQRKWESVPGFDVGKSKQCITFTDNRLLKGKGIALNGKYYACIEDSAMQGVYFLRSTESVPRKKFRLILVK